MFITGISAVAQSDALRGEDGKRYVPYEERTGNESVVYFTRELSAEGLVRAYEQVSANIKERIESRHGLRQLSYMKELGMGNDRYVLIDLDNGGRRITAAEAVRGLKPFTGK